MAKTEFLLKILQILYKVLKYVKGWCIILKHKEIEEKIFKQQQKLKIDSIN